MKLKFGNQLTVLLISLFVLFLFTNPAQATSVNPSGLSASLKAGESASPQSLNTAITASSLPLDVLFIFDLSGSMSAELDECKATSTNMMNQIRSSYTDSYFGVASFMDYPGTFTYPGYSDEYGDASYGDYAWSLDQDVTSDTSAVSTAINGLSLGYGVDIPQDYSRVLYESQFVGWRANAIKVVVVMGDAPVHDLDFYSPTNYGGDPGRDATAQTADDLDFQTVVGQLKNADMRVVVIDTGNDSDAALSFNYMANQTGGLYRLITDTGDIPDTIVSSVQTTAKLSSLSLSATSGYENWFSYTPSSYSDVGGGETKEFQITLKSPSDATPGTYNFYINVQGSGSGLTTLASIPATVVVKPSTLPETGSSLPLPILSWALASIIFSLIFGIGYWALRAKK